MSEYGTSILVTGGTHGLGYQTALSLARQRPSTLIVVASRTDLKNVAFSINKQLGQMNVRYMSLNLGSLANVRAFATKWAAEGYPPIEALVLNAAIQIARGIEYTNDGIEKHFAVNHVGHALLFHLLVPRLTPDARIVITSSGAHDPAQKWGLIPAYTSPEEAANPNAKQVKRSSGRDRYATSKVANVLWGKALGRHAAAKPKGEGMTVVIFDPGLMFPTRLLRDASWPLRLFSQYIAPRIIPVLRVLINNNINGTKKSGANLAWLALGEEIRGLKGVYFEKRMEHGVSGQAEQEDLQEELWAWTVDRVAESREEKERFARMD